MALYFLETLVAVILATIYVILRAPAEDPGYASIAASRTQIISKGHVSTRYETGSRKSLIQGFLIFSIGFAVVPGIFIAFWGFALHVDIPSSAIAFGLAGIAVFQIISFIVDFFVLGVLTPASASFFLKQSMGRVALIYLSVFAGMILALLFKIEWFIYPFAILKTVTDITALFQKNPAQTSVT